MYKVIAIVIAAIAIATAYTSNLFAQQEKDLSPLPKMDEIVDIPAQPSHFHGNKKPR
jgi:hypothetical protein